MVPHGTCLQAASSGHGRAHTVFWGMHHRPAMYTHTCVPAHSHTCPHASTHSTQNAKLVTCSLGGAAVQGSEIFQTAVRLLARSGGLVVASAGNTFRNVDLDPFYPASFSEVFSVAATDEQDQIASFSNFGR